MENLKKISMSQFDKCVCGYRRLHHFRKEPNNPNGWNLVVLSILESFWNLIKKIGIRHYILAWRRISRMALSWSTRRISCWRLVSSLIARVISLIEWRKCLYGCHATNYCRDGQGQNQNQSNDVISHCTLVGFYVLLRITE